MHLGRVVGDARARWNRRHCPRSWPDCCPRTCLVAVIEVFDAKVGFVSVRRHRPAEPREQQQPAGDGDGRQFLPLGGPRAEDHQQIVQREEDDVRARRSSAPAAPPPAPQRPRSCGGNRASSTRRGRGRPPGSRRTRSATSSRCRWRSASPRDSWRRWPPAADSSPCARAPARGIARQQGRNTSRLRNAKTNWKISKRSCVTPRKNAASTFIIGGRAGSRYSP